MKTVRINAGEFGSNCWLLIDEATNNAVLIDPSPKIDIIVDFVEARQVKLTSVLLTHGHFDHMTSCDSIRDKYNIPLGIHRLDEKCMYNSEYNAYRIFMASDLVFRPADILLDDNDTLTFGNCNIRVIHTPGHTKGSVCYAVEDSLYTGDTLFDGGVGRTDLAGGSQLELMSSLKKLYGLQYDYKIFTGHGSNTTLFKQKQFNPYFKHISD